jgi:hypothetical protein
MTVFDVLVLVLSDRTGNAESMAGESYYTLSIYIIVSRYL